MRQTTVRNVAVGAAVMLALAGGGMVRAQDPDPAAAVAARRRLDADAVALRQRAAAQAARDARARAAAQQQADEDNQAAARGQAGNIAGGRRAGNGTNSENGDVPPGCRRIEGEITCPPPPPPPPTRPSEAEVAAGLFADGPSLAPGGDGSDVRGFVRNGWPIVADFQPPPNSRTWLFITLYDPSRGLEEPTLRLEMDRTGTAGRHMYVLPQLDLPEAGQAADGSEAVRVAHFEIKAKLLNAEGKAKGSYVPVEVFGFGAGPRAVAPQRKRSAASSVGGTPRALRLDFSPSPGDAGRFYRPVQFGDDGAGAGAGAALAVSNIAFGPARPAVTDTTLRYGYLLAKPFDLVAEDVWRYCTKFLCDHTSFSRRLRRVGGPQLGGFVPAKAGPYRLYVRGWLQCAAGDYRSCEDAAAWTAGHSDTLVVQH